MTRKSLSAASALAAFFISATVTHGQENSLSVDVFNPGAAAIFPTSSALISGDTELLLVDAQFSKADAEKLVEKIKASNKKLKAIFISHSDPEYYFGLDTLHDAFPEVPVLATAPTVAAIKGSSEEKLAFWRPVLKDNAPQRVIVPETLTGRTLTVDGKTIEVRGLDGPSPERTYLWVPSVRAVAGGVLVFANTHVWVADSQSQSSRSAWRQSLEEILALNPDIVVPGHYLPDPDGAAPFSFRSAAFTLEYLNAFELAAQSAPDAKTLIATLNEKFPALAGQASLELSAKVIKGEMSWPIPTTQSVYPGTGRKIEVRFGETVFQLNFMDERTMHFVGTQGPFKGSEDTVQYTAVPIRPQVFMVYWHEPRTGANVVHVQDFLNAAVHTNIAQPDGTFLHMTGTLRLQESD